MTQITVNFAYRTDETNKKNAQSYFAKFKKEHKATISKVSVSSIEKTKNNFDDYVITGTCTINVEAAAEKFNQYGKELREDGFVFSLPSAELKLFNKTKKDIILAELAKENAAKDALRVKYADELADLPKGTIYMYEHGESRGDFEQEDKTKASTLKETILTSLSFENFVDNVSELFGNLFYNVDLKNKTWREAVLIVFNAIMKGKHLYASTEESTVGIGLDLKKLYKKVDNREGKARMGNQKPDSILKVLDKKYLKNK